MCTGTSIAAIIAAVVGGVSAYQQKGQAAEARQSQRHSNRAQLASQKAADIAAKRKQFRDMRIRRAQIAQAASGYGIGGSSTVAGANSTLTQNFAASSAFQSQQSGTAMVMGKYGQNAMDAQTRGQEWGAVGDISSNVFNAAYSNTNTQKDFQRWFS